MGAVGSRGTHKASQVLPRQSHSPSPRTALPVRPPTPAPSTLYVSPQLPLPRCHTPCKPLVWGQETRMGVLYVPVAYHTPQYKHGSTNSFRWQIGKVFCSSGSSMCQVFLYRRGTDGRNISHPLEPCLEVVPSLEPTGHGKSLADTHYL